MSIKQDLKRIAVDLELRASEYAASRRRLAIISVRFGVEYAKSYASTDCSLKIDDRKALATIATEHICTEKSVLEAETDVLKLSIKVLENTLSDTQTLASLIKTEEQIERGFGKL